MPTFRFDDDHYTFPTRIETDRLLCKSVVSDSLTPHDLYDLHNHDAIDDVFAYLPADPHESLSDAAQRLENNRTSFEEHERGTYFVYERDDPDTIIGKLGVMTDWDIDEGSWYIWLLPEYHGNGYATELGDALLPLAFDELHLATMRAYAATQNTASQNMLRKTIVEHGGQREGTLRNYERMNDDLKDAVLYSITQDEWSE